MKVFDLLIWGIITIAVFFVILNIFGNLLQEEPIEKKIETELKNAQLPFFMGKTILVGTTILNQNQQLSENYFDTRTKTLIIECNNENICCPLGEDCPKSIKWDPKNLITNKTTTTTIFVRCIKIEDYPACKIYIGKKPAQATINEINILQQTNSQIILELIVENTGNQNLSFGSASFELFRKVGSEFQKIEHKLDSQEIMFLPISTKNTFLWEIDLDLAGEYKAQFIFKGENAGFDKKEIEFNIEYNTECEINKEKAEIVMITDQEIISQGFLQKEYHYCNNCNFAYECLAVWRTQYPEIQFNLDSKERVICYSKNTNIFCYETN